MSESRTLDKGTQKLFWCCWISLTASSFGFIVRAFSISDSLHDGRFYQWFSLGNRHGNYVVGIGTLSPHNADDRNDDLLGQLLSGFAERHMEMDPAAYFRLDTYSDLILPVIYQHERVSRPKNQITTY